MKSVSGRNWKESIVNKNLIEKLHQENNFSHILSKLIISRKFDHDEIFSLENDVEFSNIFKNDLDFTKSINFLKESIDKEEKICILGDYDVDGSVATSLFVKFLKYLDHPFFYYIPDREKDGYGASKKLFEKLIRKKPNLVIMVDCGSSANEAIDYLNKKKIKSIIIDHHEIDKPYPKANVIINPKKNIDYIKHDYFCATALTYFFLDLFVKKFEYKFNLRKDLIFVLLAMVCDVMPLRKINRFIAKSALREFNIKNNCIIKEIYNQLNKKNQLNLNDLGFLVGPILNSGGRLGKSSYSTELLTSDDRKKIKLRSSQLIKLNEHRKKIEKIILNQIDLDKINKSDEKIIIYYDPLINEGIIGIIAARLKDLFNKPSFVITNSTNILKSSARSVKGYNVGAAIKRAMHKRLITKGGGHSMAAGFVLDKNNLSLLKKFLINDFSKYNTSKDFTFKYDAEVSSSILNKNFLNEIKKIEPFGHENEAPIFLFKQLKVIKPKLLNNNHISSILKSRRGFSIKSICFNSRNTKIEKYLFNYKNELNVVGQISENFWDNKKILQLIIKDLIL